MPSSKLVSGVMQEMDVRRFQARTSSTNGSIPFWQTEPFKLAPEKISHGNLVNNK